jgi:N4-gp56 family major capsid protein
MSLSTTSSNSSNLHLYYSKVWLDTLQPRLVLAPLGKPTPLPKGNGKQVKWLRYSRIAGNTSALSEGVTPSEGSFTTQNVTATISQYGDYVKITDLLDMTAIDPVIENVMELMGEAAAQTIEDLIVAELDANAAIQYVNARANANAILAGDVPVMKEFIRAMLTHKKNLVGKHKQGAYMVVLNPSHEYDLLVEQNVGGWLDVNQYSLSDQKNVSQAEIGKAYGMRFQTSDRMTSAANTGSISVANSYVIGQEAFGVVQLDGKNFELIMKDRKSGGVANPLELFSTVGYKLPGFVAKYLGGSSNGTADRIITLKGASAL